jgi:hypothetical protein
MPSWIFEPDSSMTPRLLVRCAMVPVFCGSCQRSRGGVGRRFRGDAHASHSVEVGTGIRSGISWGKLLVVSGVRYPF